MELVMQCPELGINITYYHLYQKIPYKSCNHSVCVCPISFIISQYGDKDTIGCLDLL